MAFNFSNSPSLNQTVTISGNIYRWDGTSWVSVADELGNTDGLSEGTTNLYYTDARARSSISVGGDLSYNSSTGLISWWVIR